MLNVVLHEPEIPSNTGNIGRTCVLTGARLHLVGPLGFSLDDASLRRAGMAYWGNLDVRVYASWTEFLEKNPMAETVDAIGTAVSGGAPGGSELVPPLPHLHLLTKAGAAVYSDATYRDGDYLVFGKESTGIPLDILAAHPGACERIPMLPDAAALDNAQVWRTRHRELHPDICGNFVDRRSEQISSLNLSNSVAIVLYEALRQTGFAGM